MKMRPLIIDEEAKLKVKQVLDFAATHPYEPPDAPPGDNPNYVVYLDTYRVVFSFTTVESGTYRDLSISVPDEGKYPNPVVAFTIASLFGFTGYDGVTLVPPKGWLIEKDIEWPAIRICQKIK